MVENPAFEVFGEASVMAVRVAETHQDIDGVMGRHLGVPPDSEDGNCGLARA